MFLAAQFHTIFIRWQDPLRLNMGSADSMPGRSNLAEVVPGPKGPF